MHTFSSKIIKGHGRGKSLGFPTINFDVSKVPEKLEYGVYKCGVRLNGSVYKGIAIYGPNLTFGDTEPKFEVHVLGCKERVPKAEEGLVRIFEKIRDVKRFRSARELKEQIERDILDVSL